MDDQPEPHAAEPERIRALVDAQAVPADAGLVGELDRVCLAVVADLELSGATITLLPSADSHAVAAASDDAARKIEELQFDAGEGPTGEASRTSTPVLVPDLLAQALGRWPGFVTAAGAAGVGAAFAFPLHVGASRFGALTLYRSVAGTLGDSRVRAALMYADLAVEMLIDSLLPLDHNGQQPEAGLQRIDRALDGQHHVYQAQGMVMVQLGVSLPEALARMRAHAYYRELSLAALSTAIIQGTIVIAKGDEHR